MIQVFLELIEKGYDPDQLVMEVISWRQREGPMGKHSSAPFFPFMLWQERGLGYMVAIYKESYPWREYRYGPFLKGQMRGYLERLQAKHSSVHSINGMLDKVQSEQVVLLVDVDASTLAKIWRPTRFKNTKSYVDLASALRGTDLQFLKMEENAEVFQLGMRAWDVDKAEQIIGHRTATEMINPNDFRAFINLIRVDKDHAMTVDTSKPVILAWLEEDAWIPIDGWHRISRAINENIAGIPAHILSKEESEACELPW